MIRCSSVRWIVDWYVCYYY